MENDRRERARQYLMGDLSEQEAIEFEDQYFADNELFHEMTGLEDDLLDSYVRGELSQNERQQFEKGYLISPARRVNLEFAKTLTGHLSGAAPSEAAPQRKPLRFFPPVHNWPGRIARAAIALVAIAAFSWTAKVNQRLRHELDFLRTRQAEFQRQNQALRQEIAALNSRSHEIKSSVTPPQTPATVLSLVLTPGLSRSTRPAKTLVVDAIVSQVQLTLYIDRDIYFSYRAALENEQGQIWAKGDLKSHAGSEGARAVTVKLSASLFKNRAYLVKLSGLAANGSLEGVDDYRFQVVRH